jgi:trehalose-6-phosphate synthase
VLGVDRLDYAKGIPERLLGSSASSNGTPDWRRRVALLQIAVPTQFHVPGSAT